MRQLVAFLYILCYNYSNTSSLSIHPSSALRDRTLTTYPTKEKNMTEATSVVEKITAYKKTVGDQAAEGKSLIADHEEQLRELRLEQIAEAVSVLASFMAAHANEVNVQDDILRWKLSLQIDLDSPRPYDGPPDRTWLWVCLPANGKPAYLSVVGHLSSIPPSFDPDRVQLEEVLSVLHDQLKNG